MDFTYTNNKSNNRLIGYLVTILVLFLVANELTTITIKTDINGIHDSLKFIGNNYNVFIFNCINSLLILIAYIAVSAALLLGLRVFHPTLIHFISFGIAATGLTIMVAASGSLSILNITKEYLHSQGIESDIIAINGLSIAELRKNAFLIAYSIEATSILLFGIFIAVSKIISRIVTFTSILFGIMFVSLSWLKYGSLSFQIAKILIIANYLLIAVLFLKLGYKKENQE